MVLLVNCPNADCLEHWALMPIMLEIVATNVIANQLPTRGPTGTPTACANISDSLKYLIQSLGHVFLCYICKVDSLPNT